VNSVGTRLPGFVQSRFAGVNPAGAIRASRCIVVYDQLIFRGSLLEVLGMHFLKNHRVPGFIALIGWNVVLSGPPPQANLLNEVNLRQSRVHDCSPFVRYNRVGKETTVTTVQVNQQQLIIG